MTSMPPNGRIIAAYVAAQQSDAARKAKIPPTLAAELEALRKRNAVAAAAGERADYGPGTRAGNAGSSGHGFARALFAAMQDGEIVAAVTGFQPLARNVLRKAR